jgi:hypothetical protein
MVPVSEGLIREQLDRILSSHEFRASRRSQEFLRHVVFHTLAGEADTLKERTIGIDLFGRAADYDPGEDATVRVKAGEVRKRLGLYYASEGARDSLRIELPSGSYVPVFRMWEPGEPVPLPSPPAPTEGRRISTKAIWLSIGGIAAAAILAFAGWKLSRPSQTALEQFWEPVTKGSTPVSLCAAYVPVWSPDDSKRDRADLKVSDFTYLPDQYVGGGDLIAVARLAAMLTGMKRSYLVRVGNGVSFRDLRSSPSILVGYSYTQWKEISRQMRYFIDASQHPVMITDNGKPTQWTLANLPADRHTDEDYAIVSRLFHPDTRAMLVEISGVTQYGTDAAGELVTNGALLAEALREAPTGWQNKNLQLVLRVKVISGAPAPARVVASYFW